MYIKKLKWIFTNSKAACHLSNKPRQNSSYRAEMGRERAAAKDKSQESLRATALENYTLPANVLVHPLGYNTLKINVFILDYTIEYQ